MHLSLIILFACANDGAGVSDTAGAVADEAPEDAGADTAPQPADDTGAPGTPPAPPTLKINEFMARNGGALTLDDDSTPDWIELVNTGESTLSLGGFLVSDTLEDPALHTLSADLSVAPGGFMVLYASGDSDLGPAHLPFKLNGDGEALVLSTPSGFQLDALEYGPQATDVAAARVRDGDDASGWHLVENGSPGSSNHGR